VLWCDECGALYDDDRCGAQLMEKITKKPFNGMAITNR
jgi:hypothetical protein